jgi:hypothetical protein
MNQTRLLKKLEGLHGKKQPAMPAAFLGRVIHRSLGQVEFNRSSKVW